MQVVPFQHQSLSVAQLHIGARLFWGFPKMSRLPAKGVLASSSPKSSWPSIETASRSGWSAVSILRRILSMNAFWAGCNVSAFSLRKLLIRWIRAGAMFFSSGRSPYRPVSARRVRE